MIKLKAEFCPTKLVQHNFMKTIQQRALQTGCIKGKRFCRRNLHVSFEALCKTRVALVFENSAWWEWAPWLNSLNVFQWFHLHAWPSGKLGVLTYCNMSFEKMRKSNLLLVTTSCEGQGRFVGWQLGWMGSKCPSRWLKYVLYRKTVEAFHGPEKSEF